MSTITKELAKLFRKITNSEIDAEGNAHVVLSPADSLLINNARIALASLEAEAVACIDQANLDYLESGDATVWPATSADAGDVLLYTAPQPLTTSERAELENYRNAQQVAPSDGRDQFEEWFKFHHGDEHSIAMLQRANGGLNYIDPYVDLAWISWKDSRAAMLHGKAEPVTSTYKLPPHVYRELVNSLRDTAVKYQGCQQLREQISETLSAVITHTPHCGNSPVTPDGWVACSERMPEDRESVLLWDIDLDDACSGHYSHQTGNFYQAGMIIDNEITHWQPLPAAPQQESE